MLSKSSVTTSLFLSTPSARRATEVINGRTGPRDDFYPRPPRGGRLENYLDFVQHKSISIHALREEGDVYRVLWSRQPGISIHALREEGDWPINGCSSPSPYFYPRPPRGGRRYFKSADYIPQKISIHALREEGDLRFRPPSTHSTIISIHALREEGDQGRCSRRWPLGGFLSTPSARRATLILILLAITPGQFLSTPSARRATPLYKVHKNQRLISIHALREEGDHGYTVHRA